METVKPVNTREFDLNERLFYMEAARLHRSSFWTMVDKLLPGLHDKAEARRLRVAMHFKRCPLCESLNIVESEECGTCTWHGAFDHDPVTIESRFVQLIEGCPSLVEEYPRYVPKGMSLRVRVRQLLRTVFHKRVDIRA